MLLTLKRVVRICAALTGWLTFNVGLAYAFLPGPDFPEEAFAFFFFAGNAAVALLLIYWRHRRRDRWIQDEAQRWLTKRSAKTLKPRTKWINKIQRGALWVPSLMALTVILFEPEAMGVVSHLVVARTVQLNEYRVPTPLTSFAPFYWHGSPSIGLMAGKGIARMGLRAWLRDGYQFSSLFFSAQIDDDSSLRMEGWIPSSSRKILSEKTEPFVRGTLTCRDIGYVNDVTWSKDFADIICVSSGRDFSGQFYGPRVDEDKLDEILKKVTGP